MERLVIKNFGPIKNASFDLRRFTLFIGKQASGKSTVAKLLAILKSALFLLESKQVSPNYSRFFAQYGINNYFSVKPLSATSIEYISDDYEVVFDGASGWRINLSKRLEEHIKLVDNQLHAIVRTYIKNKSTEGNFDETELLRGIYEANKQTYFEGEIAKKQNYIPADRTLFSLIDENAFSLGNLPLPFFLREFGKEFEIARQKMQSYPIDFLGLNYVHENGKSRVYTAEDESLLLSESASGLQAVIPMMLVMESLKSANTSFIVEEPELNLFPTTQKEIVQFLVNCCNSTMKNELLITTHSPYVLSSLNILLLSYITSFTNRTNADKVRSLTEEALWINPDEFNAFYFADGMITEIFDRRINIISSNELDNVSEDIDGTYQELMSIYRQRA